MDIGSGTQDVFLYQEGRQVENMVQLILPSPTVLVAREVEMATERGEHICLVGRLMGGGPSTRAVRRHLAAGLSVYSLPEPALTIKDNLDVVQEMGIVLVEEVPPDSTPITMGDLRLEALSCTLANWGIALPREFALAVMDHGFSPTESNRRVRFRYWEGFLEGGGALADLAFAEAPAFFTRMQALQTVLPQAVVMDTGGAAIWGALDDPAVQKASCRGGVVVVNVGNQHVLGVLLFQERIFGLFEHHTSQLKGKEILRLINALREGRLTHEEVYSQGGHGAASLDVLPSYPFDFVAVTGPRRDILKGYGLHMAAPYGNMMLNGCFGLIHGWRQGKKQRETG